MAEKKRMLGRGLSALLEESGGSAQPGERALVATMNIVPNPAQPRRRFDAAALDELTESVRLRGILQPILVRPLDHARYEIVAGERRWRAAQAAQLHEIPVVIRDLDDAAAFEIALIENVQRSDLNPIEEALGFARLMRDFGHTQEALAQIVGKARSHVANLLRLLDLPSDVRMMVEDGRLSMGHARALASSPDPHELALRVIAGGLSVRQTEALVRTAVAATATPRRPVERDPNLAGLERQIADALGMPVSIAIGKQPGRGSMTIDYSTLDQLDVLCGLLSVDPA